MAADAGAAAVEVEGLRKRFGDVVALDGLDLRVEPGTVFGLLGPNGAGKTTLVRIVATLLPADGGRAEVLGHDIIRESLAVRRRIGLAGQFAAVDAELTGRENVVMIGRLMRLSKLDARRRADEVLERFGLSDAADRRVGTYSGGMRRGSIWRRGSSAAHRWCCSTRARQRALTRGRVRSCGGSVDELRREGTAVLLTTQYLERGRSPCAADRGDRPRPRRRRGHRS